MNRITPDDISLYPKFKIIEFIALTVFILLKGQLLAAFVK